MPMGDITAGVVEVLGRWLVSVVVDVVFDTLVKRVGYFIAAHILRLRMPDPDGIPVLCIGLAFWALLCFGAFSLLN